MNSRINKFKVFFREDSNTISLDIPSKKDVKIVTKPAWLTASIVKSGKVTRLNMTADAEETDGRGGVILLRSGVDKYEVRVRQRKPETMQGVAFASVEPEPVVEEITPEPEPEPVVEEITPEPVAEEVTPEPVVEEVTPEPEPEPVVEEITPEPEPEPVVEEATTEPVVEEATPEPEPEPVAEVKETPVARRRRKQAEKKAASA